MLAISFSAVLQADVFKIANQSIELEIDMKPMPIFPYSLESAGIYSGSVLLVFEVDHYGEIRDYLVTESSHKAFVRSVESVVEKWDCSVPKMNGEPVSIVASLEIKFSRDGGIVSMNVAGAANMRTSFGKLLERRKSLISPIDKLDNYPQPITRVDPLVSREIIDNNKGSKGIFKFYVDSEGNVRMPTLLRSEGDLNVDMLLAAQEALQQWKFTPPTVKGKPAMVELAQPFVFKDSGALTSN